MKINVYANQNFVLYFLLEYKTPICDLISIDFNRFKFVNCKYRRRNGITICIINDMNEASNMPRISPFVLKSGV